MKTAKTKRLNFNTYMQLPYPDRLATPLANVWVSKRGRLSRTSVEARAISLGRPAGEGFEAWDAFIEARNRQVAAECMASDTLQTSLPYNS
jgi:hypothetical protein